MKKRSQRRGFLWRLAPILLILAVLTAAQSCKPPIEDLGKYPAPPPTQKLATLLAQGIATASPRSSTEYPPPIPGPLRGETKAPPTSPSPATATPPPASLLPDAVEAAGYYLAGHLGLNRRQVELDSWEEALWLSPALGCLPGESLAAPSPVAGYRSVFLAGGQAYEVHSDASGQNMCVAEALLPGERIPLDAKTGLDAASLARQHLASRLGIDLNQVTVLEVQPAEWKDETLGCASLPGKQTDAAAPRPIQGERILLSAREITHEYHSGGDWLVYCGVIE